MPASALNDLRVLDLGSQATALTGRILADLGADVILVEPPSGGRQRRLAPFVADEPGPDRSYHHLYYNANKRSVVLHRSTSDGADLLRSLIRTADVVIEAGPTGVEAALGLGIDELWQLNGRLIVVSVTPYGRSGLRGSWKATDLTAEAAGGLLQVTGEVQDPPVKGPADPAYTMAGLAAAAGALIAIHGQRKQPRSSSVHIDISLQEATMAALIQTSNPNTYLWRGEVPTRPGLSQVMKCADGRWAGANILGNRIEGFIALLDELGIEHSLTADNWTALHSKRGAWQYLENPIQYLAMEAAARLPRDAFVDKIQEAGSAAMPVYTFPEMDRSEHFMTTREFRDVGHETLEHPLSFAKSPVDCLDPGFPIRRAPLLGEHTDDVRASLEAAVLPLQAAAQRQAGEGPWMPLKGIRVIDFCWVIAGPYGTRMLASFGAEVIKVESSKRIDSLRNQVLPNGDYHHDLPDTFNDVNTGKHSVTLDLSTEEGRDLARRLIAVADVVVDNYTAGSLARMGFRYEELKQTNPGLIMLHLPGFGRDSPWAKQRSLGNLLMAASGMNYLSGLPGRPPRGMGVAYPDFTTPFLTVTTILSCLHERARTGVGREMELSQLSAAVSLIGAEWMRFKHTGQQPPRPGNRDPNHCPHGVYPAAGEDRWVAIAVEDDDQWHALANLIGGPALAADPRFATHLGRKANEEAIDEHVGAWTRGRDRWRVAEQLQVLGIAASAVEDLRDLMDADVGARGHYQRVFQPVAPNFEIAVDAEAIRFVGEERVLARAPMLGEHNEQVLRDVLGLSEDEIAQLVIAGVVS